MLGSKFDGNGRLRAWGRAVSRGTLFCALGVVVFAPGCCTTDDDCEESTDPCFVNTCVIPDGAEQGQCALVPATATCDDGDDCTDGDVCDGTDAGVCAGTAIAGCCEDDTDCDPAADGTAQVCVNSVCTKDCSADATVCDDSNECTDDACVAGLCENTNNTAACDDGDICTDGDACADGACAGAAIADCCEVDGDCNGGDTCNTTTNTCEAVVVGPSVTVDNCPANANQNSTASISASSSGFAAGGTMTYAWSGTGATFDPTDADSTTVTYTGSGTINQSVTVTNETADGTETATGSCSTEVAFTPQLTCSAGNLLPARSAVGTWFSGDQFGTASTGGPLNFLQGNGVQQGFDQSVFAFRWTVDSQPSGAGAVILTTPTQPICTYNIGAPAEDGLYAFQLEVTNTQTSEVCIGTTTLELIDPPGLRLAGTDPARRNVLAGDTVTMNLEYNASATTTYNVYGKQGDLTTGANQILLGTVPDLPTTGGTWQPVPFPLDSSKVRTTADLQAVGELDLGFNSIDTVGVLPAANATTQLAKSAAAEPIANHRNAILTVGAGRTNTQLAAVGTGTADVPKNPAGIDLDDQIGMPVGLGTGNDVQALNANNVIYPGIGPSGAVAGTDGSELAHIARTMYFGHDINGDGLTDTVFGTTATGIEVLYGSPSINSAGGLAFGDAAGAAGLAPNADAPANQDWQAPGAFATGLRSQLAVANLLFLNVGDFNNDGQLDFATLDGAGGAVNNARIILLDDSVANDANPFTAAFNTVWTSTDTGTGANGGVGVGDFDGDGIVDAGFGMPAEDEPAGANTEGIVLLIYGGADTTSTLGSAFPATGTILATFVGSANGFASRGTAAANSLWGTSFMMADVTGGNTADLVFFKALVGTQEINVITGSSGGVDPADPADDSANIQINEVTANDFAGGFLGSGFLTTGATKRDLICGLPGLDTGSSLGNVNEGAAYVIPSTSLPGAATAINAIVNTVFINNLRTGATVADNSQLGFGTGVGSLDFDGDGDEDLLVGQDAMDGEFIYVFYGPLTVAGQNFNDTQNGASLFMAAANGEAVGFEGFWLADINGDNVNDFVMAGTNWAGYMSGLETTAP